MSILKFIGNKDQTYTAKIYDDVDNSLVDDNISVTEVMDGSNYTGIYQITFPAVHAGNYILIIEDVHADVIIGDFVEWNGSTVLSSYGRMDNVFARFFNKVVKNKTDKTITVFDNNDEILTVQTYIESTATDTVNPPNV